MTYDVKCAQCDINLQDVRHCINTSMVSMQLQQYHGEVHTNKAQSQKVESYLIMAPDMNRYNSFIIFYYEELGYNDLEFSDFRHVTGNSQNEFCGNRK